MGHNSTTLWFAGERYCGRLFGFGGETPSIGVVRSRGGDKLSIHDVECFCLGLGLDSGDAADSIFDSVVIDLYDGRSNPGWRSLHEPLRSGIECEAEPLVATPRCDLPGLLCYR